MQRGADTWGHKFNAFVMGLLAVAVLGVVVNLGNPMLLPFAAIFWAYAVATVFLIEWAVLHVRARKSPAIPFLPSRFAGSRGLLIAMLTLVGIVTLLREGALAPDVVLTFNQYTTQSHTNHQSTSNSQRMGNIRLAGRALQCQMDCSPQASTACEAALAASSCREDQSSEVAHVSVQIQLGPEPFCYTPLLKSGEIQFNAQASIHASGPGGSVSHNVQIHGTTDLEMTGVGSCYTFRQLLGREIGSKIASTLTEVLSNN